MSFTCVDCGAELEAPEDTIVGEIISCPDCGLDYAIIEDTSGQLVIQELMIEGEDWGE